MGLHSAPRNWVCNILWSGWVLQRRFMVSWGEETQSEQVHLLVYFWSLWRQSGGPDGGPGGVHSGTPAVSQGLQQLMKLRAELPVSCLSGLCATAEEKAMWRTLVKITGASASCWWNLRGGTSRHVGHRPSARGSPEHLRRAAGGRSSITSRMQEIRTGSHQVPVGVVSAIWLLIGWREEAGGVA